jgi:uncharacterized membrane protein YkoI
MKRKGAYVLAAVAIATSGVIVGTAAISGPDTPITGPALERATEAALTHTGSGVVTATEVGDEESLYEVEVTFADGTRLDVQLDADFLVITSSADDDTDDD